MHIPSLLILLSSLSLLLLLIHQGCLALANEEQRRDTANDAAVNSEKTPPVNNEKTVPINNDKQKGSPPLNPKNDQPDLTKIYQPFPDRRQSAEPILQMDTVFVAAKLTERPGNIEVDTTTNRIFFTHHPAFANLKEKGIPNVAELIKNPLQTDDLAEIAKHPQYRAFPDEDAQKNVFNTVLSVRVAKKRRWLLCLDYAGMKTGSALHVIDIGNDDKLIKTYVFPQDVAPEGSNLNDFVVSRDEKHIFIADTGIGSNRPGIVVLNLDTWQAHRTLNNHESTTQKTWNPIVINNTKVELPWKIGVDTIALSPRGDKLYFGACLDPFLWVVPTKYLLSTSSHPEWYTEVITSKPMSDGAVVDPATGVIYITDFQHQAILVASPAMPKKMRTLLPRNPLMRWPDGLSIGKGYLWITCSAIDSYLGANERSGAPFHILRVPLVRDLQMDPRETLTVDEL